MDNQSYNLTIPRGAVLFAEYLPGTQVPGPYRDLGNCPEFTLTRSSDVLAHYSSKAGVRVKDAEIMVNTDMAGTVTMDDISPENMAFWFMNNTQTITISSATGQTESLTDVTSNGIYQLGRSTVAPLGLRGLANVSVSGAGGTPEYTVNVDYTIDEDNGLLTILPTGAITAGTDLTVEYDVAASTFQQVEAGEVAAEGELKFISQNPYGPNRVIMIPRAKIMPTGDMSLMTDPESPTWQQMTFNLSVLKKGNLALAYDADGLPANATA